MRFKDRNGWGRIVETATLPAVMRVQAWCAIHLDYNSSFQPVSQARLSRELGCSQAQASRALATLRECGWLEAWRCGREWRYRLNMEMGWCGSAEAYSAEVAARRQMAEFERLALSGGSPDGVAGEPPQPREPEPTELEALCTDLLARVRTRGSDAAG